MPNNESFIYQIGGKKYIQKRLVLGQIEQLNELLEGTSFPGELTPMSVVAALKGKIYFAVAIALTEEGKSPKDKDLAALSEQLKWEMDGEQLITVVEDFFVCNPIASLLEKLTGAIMNLRDQVKAAGSRISSALSQEATSLSETPSSGDLPSKNADLT